MSVVNNLQKYFDPSYTGTIIEIGAYHPIEISSTYDFEQKGWDTYQIEANPENIPAFSIRKNGCLNYAISDKNEDDVDFTIVTIDSEKKGFNASFSSLNPNLLGHDEFPSKKVKVKVRTMNTLFENELKHLKDRKIDIITIDVEGHELEVLDGMNLNVIQPKVFCIEDLTRLYFDDKKFYESISKLHKRMTDYNYVLDYSDGSNSFYVKN